MSVNNIHGDKSPFNNQNKLFTCILINNKFMQKYALRSMFLFQ